MKIRDFKKKSKPGPRALRHNFVNIKASFFLNYYANIENQQKCLNVQ